MDTKALKNAIIAVGGNVDDMPDNLITTHLQRLCDVLGIDTSEQSDKLVTSYLAQISSEYTGGGSDEEWFNDGDTHIWITLTEGRTSPRLGVCPKGTVTVDWGDGTEPDTLTGTSTSTVKWTPTHNYAKPGDYVITLRVDGEMALSGVNSSSAYSYLLRYASGGDGRNSAYRNSIIKVEVGDSTSIGGCAFYYCYSLTSVSIPGSVTSIEGNAFSGCQRLTSVSIPDSVTSIGSKAFGYCGSVRYYDFTCHTQIPTITSDAFGSIPDDCEIRVPAALYDEWIAATNWSTYAANIVAV